MVQALHGEFKGKEDSMYGILITALLLFPWSLALYIAFGALCAARKRSVANKQMRQVR